MEIIPAIYLLDGMCVALYKSSFEQKQTYLKSPTNVARNFEKSGAKKLYIIDLNGKQTNTFEQKGIIRKIIENVGMEVWVEAGFHSLEEIQAAFNLGASKISLRAPGLEFVKKAIEKFGAEKIIILLQSKASELIPDGPKEPSAPVVSQPIDVVDYAEKLVPLGVKYVIYKDERSEGTLIHPNYDEVDRLFLTTGENLKIYASGGISDPKHLQLLKKIGASGAVIGKAFYEGIITFQEAERALKTSIQ